MKRIFNFLRDYIVEYLIIILLVVGVFFLAIYRGSYAEDSHSRLNDPEYYANKIFDDSRVHKVEVEISPENLQSLLSAPLEKNRFHVSVAVDGERYDDVAFSTRGNGTLVDMSKNDSSSRYSYTLNFKKFNDKCTYHGLDKIILNSLVYEQSYLESYLAFRLANSTGLEMPLTAFTELYINGNLEGVYLAIEAVDRSYLDRIGASKDSAVFHPIPYNVDWDKLYQDEKLLKPGERIDTENHPDSSSQTYGGSDLSYRGDSPDAYRSIFTNATTKFSKIDERLIIKGIESLSDASDLDAEDYWDTTSVLRFFASLALAPNTDSYLSHFAQNYYLILSFGKLSVLPWDNDRSFMINGTSPESLHSDGMINLPIDSPTFGVTPEERPLWWLVVSNEKYLERYHQIIQDALDNYLLNGEARRDYDKAVELIRSKVYSDPSRLYPTDEFEDHVNYLRNYIMLRADSLQKQLWGLLPRTSEENGSLNIESLAPSDVFEETEN